MKIIGQTNDGFIVEMSQDDMAAVVGETYFAGERCQQKLQAVGIYQTVGYSKSLSVGAVVPLAGRFSRMVELERKHGQLRDVSNRLRVMADLMDHLGDQVIVPPPEGT